MSRTVAVIGGGYGGSAAAKALASGQPDPMILLPLGPHGGVGQLPTPDGPTVVPVMTVTEYKGADLFTGRFAELFGTA